MRNLTSPHARFLAASFTCAVVWSYKVLRGVVNLPRIDGIQGVRGSNPLSSTRHNASAGHPLRAICQQIVSRSLTVVFPPRGVLAGSSGFRPPLRPRLAAHLGFVLDGFHANRAHPLPQPWLSPRQVCRAMLTSAATPVPERSAAGVVELGAQRLSLGEEVGAVPLGGGTALECLVEPALSLRA
jgi:hypothetical protein